MASKSLLTNIAGRNAVLGGITAGAMTREECEYHMLKDNELRPKHVAVVAEGKHFASVTKAAHYLFKQHYAIQFMSALQVYNAMCNLRVTIANKCNKDNVPGYYWA